MTTEPTIVSLNDFKTAGLEPEGIYRLQIDKMGVEVRTVQSGENAGQKYKTIAGIVYLVERFGEGLVENPAREFLNCGVSGKGLQRFRDLYLGAFGSVEGSDMGANGPAVTLEDLASALVGVDTVWTTYYWKRDRNNPDEIVGSLGWSFSSDPSTLRAPTPFAERDPQSIREREAAEV